MTSIIWKICCFYVWEPNGDSSYSTSNLIFPLSLMPIHNRLSKIYLFFSFHISPFYFRWSLSLSLSLSLSISLPNSEMLELPQKVWWFSLFDNFAKVCKLWYIMVIQTKVTYIFVNLTHTDHSLMQRILILKPTTSRWLSTKVCYINERNVIIFKKTWLSSSCDL